MRNYKQGEPRTKRENKTANHITINDSYTPQEDTVRTVPNKGVCDAFYPFPAKPHGHHLQDAQDDIDMAVWGFNEQARQLQQEDRNKDETE